MKGLLVFVALSSFLIGNCVSKVLRINNVDDFLNFTSTVNENLISYADTTILLEADIDMADIDDFEPIGVFSTQREKFCGVFDGQGHRISNLTLNTTARVCGLFGQAEGATIRNLVLDSTCKIECNFVQTSDGSDAIPSYVGGIVAYCTGSDKNCEIDNCTNHASVIYAGTNTPRGAYIGGVIGMCRADSHDCFIKSAINTGHLSVLGEAAPMHNFVGGIVGACSGDGNQGTICVVTYSVNSGGITYKGTTNRAGLGGIAGSCGVNDDFSSCFMSHCVADGSKAYEVTGQSSVKNIGGLAGMGFHGSYINNSYWSKAICEDAVGFSKDADVAANVKYDRDVKLAIPWKLTDSTLATTSGELICGLGENNMAQRLTDWIKSTYTLRFVSNTYDNIRPINLTFLESVDVSTTVPRNPEDNVFKGWFISETYIFQVPSPCVLHKDQTIYGYWVPPADIDGVDAFFPPKGIITLLCIALFALF